MVLLKEARDHPDAALVAACNDGDPSAFDELVRRYKDRVYNAVYHFTGNREDALDLAQEVFVRAYRGIGSYQGQAKVYTWLYSIATNLSRNYLRDKKRKGRNRGVSLEALEEKAPAAAQFATQTLETPGVLAQRAELEGALEACLAGLPALYREAFVLRTMEMLPYEEIAAAVDCPLGTVKSRLNQARLRLRNCLQERGVL